MPYHGLVQEDCTWNTEQCVPYQALSVRRANSISMLQLVYQRSWEGVQDQVLSQWFGWEVFDDVDRVDQSDDDVLCIQNTLTIIYLLLAFVTMLVKW